jgi:hypothetical protein
MTNRDKIFALSAGGAFLTIGGVTLILGINPDPSTRETVGILAIMAGMIASYWSTRKLIDQVITLDDTEGWEEWDDEDDGRGPA